MANDTSAFNPELWSEDIQQVFFRKNVSYELANMKLDGALAMGDTINHPYASPIVDEAYSKTDITISDQTATNEQLSIATARALGAYYDDIDQLQNKYNLASIWAKRAGMQLSNRIDQAFFAEVTNAGQYIDDGDVGGTAGNYITMSTSNIFKMFLAARTKLGLQDNEENMFFSIGPSGF